MVLQSPLLRSHGIPEGFLRPHPDLKKRVGKAEEESIGHTAKACNNNVKNVPPSQAI